MTGDTKKQATGSSVESKNNESSVFTNQEAIDLALDILDGARHCQVGTNGEDGFPNIKTMTNRKHEGLKKIWFNTDTSSMRVQQLKKDNKACVYCLDTKLSRGLMLVGNIEMLQDVESKRMLWTEGDEVFRPLGVDDPEYTVLCFTAKRGNIVDAMKNQGKTFEIE